MKKVYFLGACLLTQLAFSQYMIVGKDSISAKDFVRDNEYSLKNNGVEKTLKSSQEFMLLQQFAAEKKADTASFFQNRMMQTVGELRKERFYPQALSNSVLNDYLQANQLERKLLFFIVEKKEGDVNDYQKIYQDVKSGVLSMEDAVKKYTAQEPNPVYVKPGVMDQSVFEDLVKASNGSYSRLVNTSSYAAFAKLIETRPTLGYVIFPQSLKRVTPGAINLFTRMIKTSSLAVLIGVVEVIKVGQQIIENSLLIVPNASLWIYGLIFILYFIICYPLSRLATHLEKVWE